LPIVHLPQIDGKPSYPFQLGSHRAAALLAIRLFSSRVARSVIDHFSLMNCSPWSIPLPLFKSLLCRTYDVNMAARLSRKHTQALS
jgi:hypothetical protein